MPRVPTYDNFQETPTGLPQTQFRMPNAPDVAGPQMQQFGQAQQKFNADMAQAQDTADQLRVDDALNKAREESLRLTYDKDVGYTNIKGVAALERQSGKPLSDEYAENFQKHLESLAGELGNDRQRQYFQLKANDIATSLHGNAMQYEAGEFRGYQRSVHEGTIGIGGEEMARGYQDPKVIAGGLKSIEAAAYALAKLEGKSGQEMQDYILQNTSKALLGVVRTAVDTAPDSFSLEKFLDEHGGKMNADSLVRARQIALPAIYAKTAENIAAVVSAGVQEQFDTPPISAAYNIAAPGGATGALPPLPPGKPGQGVLPPGVLEAAQKRGGFEATVRDFKGQLAPAFAAQAVGVDKVEKAMSEAKKDGSEWLSKLPAAAQQTVVTNMKAYNEGKGRSAPPSLEQMLAQGYQMLGADATPQQKKVLELTITNKYRVQEKAIKDRQEQNQAAVYQTLWANGGNYNALPPSQIASLSPEKAVEAMSFAKKVSEGTNTTDPAVYAKLSKPGVLKSMTANSLIAYAPSLSKEHLTYFLKQHAEVTSGVGQNGAGSLNTEAIGRILRNRLGPDAEDDEFYGARLAVIDETGLVAQKVLGRQFTDAEMQKHIDGVLSTTQIFKTPFWFGADKITKERLLGMTYDDIPEGIRDSIEEKLKTEGFADGKADVLRVYLRKKFGLEEKAKSKGKK